MTVDAAPDPDRESIRQWLESLGRDSVELERLAGDVSRRRYFRARTGAQESFVVARYPPDLRDSCTRFIQTSDLLRQAGVRTPRVIVADCELGFMLLEDVGDDTLFGHRHEGWNRVCDWLFEAREIIVRMQHIPIYEVEDLNPALDTSLLNKELDLTWEVFLEPKKLVGDHRCAERLRDHLYGICVALGSEAPTVCHRDFMARNLIPTRPRPSLVVLDHQDLRLGPRFYDLASLLNDSLFAPADVENRILAKSDTTDEDRLSYHRAAAQRTLKAIGTFELFAQRGSRRHLPLIPPTLSRALHHLAQLDELSGVLPEIADRWLAAAADPGGVSHKD